MNLNKHRDFFNPQKVDETIHIIGGGALGSNLAHLLVRLGFENIVIYDFDTITRHNLTNQFYFEHQIDEPKTESLKANLLQINPEATIKIEGKYVEQYLYDYVFLCLDSIEERKRILELNEYNFHIKMLTDIRIGLEEGQCYSATPKEFSTLLTTMQFKNGESAAPRNACGGLLSILPTIQIITSGAVMNLINMIKNDMYHYMMFIDSLTGQSTKLLLKHK